MSRSPSVSMARLLIDSLIELGVRDFVLSPGSRSAPLAYSAYEAGTWPGIQLHVRIDERSAGFTALGAAKMRSAMGECAPVAVITTSGTAALNLHPAIAEAHHSGVPVIALTADRPAELRGIGANQAMEDQSRVFGQCVRWAMDMPAPRVGDIDSSASRRFLRNVAARAVAAALGTATGEPGPVHLNLAYREPLTPGTPWPDDPGRLPDRALEGLTTYCGGAMPPTRITHVPRTVVVAGDGSPRAARELAEAGSYPLFAEPSSGVRGGPAAIGSYRLLLAASPLGHRVERVVMYGHPTLSRPVSTLLGDEDVELIVVHTGSRWSDTGRIARIVAPSVELDLPDGGGDGQWLADWCEADARFQSRASAALAQAPTPTGHAIARAVWASIGPRDVLYLGSSQLIRDFDLAPILPVQDLTQQADATGAEEPGPTVLANRGLAGIDGTISAATGAALVSGGRSVCAVMGDLTFLHDVGGLLIGPLEEHPRLRLIVVNDDGGAIFETLETGDGRYPHTFERVFATPHGASIAELALAYGLRFEQVATIAELEQVLATPPTERELIEIRTDRGHRREFEQVLRQFATSAI